MTKIKKDEHGLYIQVGGWICRPPLKTTVFTEGDEVRATHPAGPLAYLRVGKKGEHGYVREAWPVKIVYWWHPSYDGKPEAEKLREHDRTRYGQSETYYREKFDKDTGFETSVKISNKLAADELAVEPNLTHLMASVVSRETKAKKALAYRKLQTILAALRMFQESPDPNMSHFIDCEPLLPKEIDELCESLHLGRTILAETQGKCNTKMIPQEAVKVKKCKII